MDALDKSINGGVFKQSLFSRISYRLRVGILTTIIVVGAVAQVGSAFAADASEEIQVIEKLSLAYTASRSINPQEQTENNKLLASQIQRLYGRIKKQIDTNVAKGSFATANTQLNYLTQLSADLKDDSTIVAIKKLRVDIVKTTGIPYVKGLIVQGNTSGAAGVIEQLKEMMGKEHDATVDAELLALRKQVVGVQQKHKEEFNKLADAITPAPTPRGAVQTINGKKYFVITVTSKDLSLAASKAQTDIRMGARRKGLTLKGFQPDHKFTEDFSTGVVTYTAFQEVQS